MKFFKTTLILFTIGTMLFMPNFVRHTSADNGEVRAKQIILTYIEAKELNIHPGENEYNIFLRGILLGDPPELTSAPSAFVKNSTEEQYIMEYAAQNYRSQQELLFPNIIEEPSFEAAPIMQEKQSIMINSSQTGSTNAISYARAWAINGGYSRNPAYVDFGVDDCTNFISQALYAGGFSQIGSGDGCKQEATSTEWYIQYDPSPSWTCLGSNRNWEWATSWSVAPDFRTYLVDNQGYATNLGYTYSAATAKYYLSPGDIVQMQHVVNGVWSTFHTMLATMENSNDLYVTYHSGGSNGLIDYVDRPLSNIATSTTTQRFLLVQLTYPDFIFSDVPPYYWAWQEIERLYNNGITAGCSTSPMRYCPENTVTRAQMAVFLLRGIHGSTYTPPPATGTMFYDVFTNTFAAAWIEQLYTEGITSGCGGGNFCPNQSVTHAQMAVFLLRSKYSSSYTPPAATGTMFNDVPTGSFAADWIEQLATENISYGAHGCSSGNYCPSNPVTRAEMAGMLLRTFNP